MNLVNMAAKIAVIMAGKNASELDRQGWHLALASARLAIPDGAHSEQRLYRAVSL